MQVLGVSNCICSKPFSCQVVAVDKMQNMVENATFKPTVVSVEVDGRADAVRWSVLAITAPSDAQAASVTLKVEGVAGSMSLCIEDEGQDEEQGQLHAAEFNCQLQAGPPHALSASVLMTSMVLHR